MQLSSQAQQQRYDEQPAQRVATLAFTIPYKGMHQGEQNRMWVLWSCDVDSGKVLLVTSNWCPFLLTEDSLYQYSQPNSESLEHHSSAEVKALEAAEKRSQQFLQRSQFDLINYGPSPLHAKTEAIAKPVLTAHAHWRALHALGHGRLKGEHYLYHEVFLRGACMTQFAEQVRLGECRIFYVSGQNDGLFGELVDSKTLGWWQNRWYLFRQGDQEYAVTALVPSVSLRDTAKATLAPCYQFADLLQQQGWLEVFKQTSPSRVNALLQCLATRFNQDKGAD
ncbi:hypothetical protein [Vibrio sp. WXL210]|uniref:hypothetical protein n=1 Tax=Vibrio sp. WXL210 TaxID=3450709 RepID=UPI003EC88148